MSTHLRRPIQALAVLAAAFVLLALSAGAARAATPGLGACGAQTLARPFVPWLDPMQYVLVRDGGLEQGGQGWLLRGATVVRGNEPFQVGGAGDVRALALGGAGAAVTPPACIALEHPTLRFFARNTGSPLGRLNVALVLTTATGAQLRVPIAVLPATAAWAPTPPLPIAVNLAAPVLEDVRRVQFALTATGGDWQVDDLYVDPYSKG